MTRLSRAIPTSSSIAYRARFFFGAAAAVGAVLDRLSENPKAYVVDFTAVPIIDSTAAATIGGFVRKGRHRGAGVFISGATPAIQNVLAAHGLQPPLVHFSATIESAVAAAHASIGAANLGAVPSAA